MRLWYVAKGVRLFSAVTNISPHAAQVLFPPVFKQEGVPCNKSKN